MNKPSNRVTIIHKKLQKKIQKTNVFFSSFSTQKEEHF